MRIPLLPPPTPHHTRARRALARKNGYPLAYNQEIVGLGLANFAGALFSAYTTTGSFSRSAVNNASGAKTQLAGFVTSIVVMFVLLFMTPGGWGWGEVGWGGVGWGEVGGVFGIVGDQGWGYGPCFCSSALSHPLSPTPGPLHPPPHHPQCLPSSPTTPSQPSSLWGCPSWWSLGWRCTCSRCRLRLGWGFWSHAALHPTVLRLLPPNPLKPTTPH